MPLGLYISVPFCRAKCSYCNFASDVFSAAKHQQYCERVCRDMLQAEELAAALGARCEREVDSIYLGGGTPTLLDTELLALLFSAARTHFAVAADAEITVECAPGTLSPQVIVGLVRCGVNRISLGVQSFVDEEARAVGRMHTRAVILQEMARLRAAGLSNINVDLIAGLPHQTRESWTYSLDQAIASGASHVSVYLLEVDEDSRLGRELIAGGARYHAHHVPDPDLTADFYEMACERLSVAGVVQYEISNFARDGAQSRHNLKYWTRQPYLGFGLDAHSMLPVKPLAGREQLAAGLDAVRFSQTDELDDFMSQDGGRVAMRESVSTAAALEESFFLGLRLNRGVSLLGLEQTFGADALAEFQGVIAEIVGTGLATLAADTLQLTPRGRLLSNEVFRRFLLSDESAPVSTRPRRERHTLVTLTR